MNVSPLYDDLDQFLAILRNTYSGDGSKIKEATLIVETMAQDYKRFVDLIVKIISLESMDDVIMKAKNSAIVNLTRCMLEKIKKEKVEKPEEPMDLEYIINNIIKMMYSTTINSAMRTNLLYFLILLYSYASTTKPALLGEGVAFVKAKLVELDLNSLQSTIMVLQGLLNASNISQSVIAEWFETLSLSLLHAGETVVSSCVAAMLEITQNPQPETEKMRLEAICQGLQIYNYWIIVIYEFMKLLSKANPNANSTSTYLRNIALSEKLVEIFAASLIISLSSGHQIQGCLISTTGLSQLDIVVNTMKTNVFRCFNKMFNTISEMKTILVYKDNKFWTAGCQYILPLCVESFLIFFKSVDKNIEIALKSKDIAEIITSILGFLSKAIIYNENNTFFTQTFKLLIVDVLFPLLRISEDEVELFKDNPEQFVHFAVDTCNKQESNVPKTQAARFLYQLCKLVDGSLSYVAYFVFYMIDYSLVCNDPKLLETNYKDLIEHSDSVILGKTDANVRVETGLVILSIISNLLCQRSDLIEMLENLLSNYKTFFLGTESSILIKSRVCLLFAFYFESIFKSDTKRSLFIEHLQFVMECAKADSKEVEVLSDQANQTIQVILDKDFLTSDLNEYIIEILKALTYTISHTKVLKTFEVILDAVNTYIYQFIENDENTNILLNLVRAIVDRIKVEMEIAAKSPEPETLNFIVNKLWAVIIKISEIEEYLNTGNIALEIEKTLTPLLPLIDKEEYELLTQNLLSFVNNSTKIRKEVSEFSWAVFATFPKIFENFEHMLSSLFQPLNQIIVYGHKKINDDPQTIEVLIEMGIQALAPNNAIADESNGSEAALLLQLILQYLHPITENQLQRIINNVIDTFPNAEHDFFKARLGGVILCAFMKDFDMVQTILAKMPTEREAFAGIINIFIEGLMLFQEKAYDRKLLVIAFSVILINQNVHIEIKKRFPKMFDIIISFLRYSRYLDQREAKLKIGCEEDSEEDEKIEKKLNDREMFLKFYDDANMALPNPNGYIEEYKNEEEKKDSLEDSSLESDDDDDYVLGKSEDAELIKNLETELKERDEYIVFRDAVLVLKEKNNTLLQELYQTLNPKKKLFLNDVLQSKRVEVGYDKTKTQARKIVTLKGKKVAQVHFEDGAFVYK